MSRLDEWILKSPYSAEDHAYMDAYTNDKRQSWRTYDSDEFTNWLIEKSRSFMKGTFLEQDLVPLTRDMHPWSFGYLAGPKVCFESHGIHEIAHAIQLKKAEYRKRLNNLQRFQQPKSSTQTILGQTYYEPSTMEVALHECEAIGISLVLLEMLGYEIDHAVYYQQWAETCRFLPDWYKGGGEPNRINILKKSIELNYLVWQQQKAIMEVRFSNFCKHVAKLRLKHPEMLPPPLRVVKAKV